MTDRDGVVFVIAETHRDFDQWKRESGEQRRCVPIVNLHHIRGRSITADDEIVFLGWPANGKADEVLTVVLPAIQSGPAPTGLREWALRTGNPILIEMMDRGASQ